MVKELIITKMVIYTQENGKTVKSMAKEQLTFKSGNSKR